MTFQTFYNQQICQRHFHLLNKAFLIDLLIKQTASEGMSSARLRPGQGSPR